MTGPRYDTEDCPNCGGEGELYRGTDPAPCAPCTSCGGRWLNARMTTWTPGAGVKIRKVRP